MVIRKNDGKYTLYSHTGKSLGSYESKGGAEHREKQVQFFKNVEKSSGGPGSLKSKVHKKGLLK